MNTFQFPNKGWRFDSSNSYGSDMLYNSISQVIVKVFPPEDKALAYETHTFLLWNGITSVRLEEVTHVTDNKTYCYVFAEKSEMLSFRARLFPEIEIATPIKNTYTRMLAFSFIGFTVFFVGSYLAMKYFGDNRGANNPYAGAPPLMTCLFIGVIGLVSGALAGLIRRNN